MSKPRTSIRPRLSIRPKKGRPPRLSLQAGRFYVDRDGSTWCCFKVDPELSAHCQARCVRVSDDRVEYFYSDGRYDEDGKSGFSLTGAA